MAGEGSPKSRGAAAAATLGAALLLAACSPSPSSLPAGALPASDYAVRDDPFQPETEIASSVMTAGELLDRAEYRLVAHRDRATGAIRLGVKCRLSYLSHGYRYYTTARSAKAEVLAVGESTRRAEHCGSGRSCPHVEVVNVRLAEPELRAAAATGYALKLYAKSGEERRLDVPARVITGLLSHLAALRKSPAAASPARNPPPPPRANHPD